MSDRWARLHRALHAHPATSLVTKLVVALVGGAVLAVGVVMIVTPGPALVLIPAGLAILATEFDFAKRWLQTARDKARAAKARAEAADPRVRRRRRVLALLAVVVVVAAVVAYLVLFDWPAYAVDGWDRVQSMAQWVPDLPGM